MLVDAAETPGKGQGMSWRPWVRRAVFARVKRLVAPAERRRYFALVREPKLNLGCGGNVISGWLNVDLCPTFGAVQMDASRPWPFDDQTFHATLCEHMIEHVDKSLAVYMCREVFRTLRAGAYFRVVTPDLNWFAERIRQPASAEEAEYLRFVDTFRRVQGTTWCDAINQIFYEHGHRYIWSIEELSAVLERIGFVDLQVTRAAHARQPVFEGVEGHPKEVGVAVDALEAFAIEARKPS